MSPRIVLIASLVLLALGFTVVIVDAQRPPPGGRRAPAALTGTGFTYQGQLKNNGALVNGSCDFQFGLWDASSLGTQVGTTQTVSSLSVTNGLFTTPPIDFGNNAFQGDGRWLGIAVSCPSGGSFTALSPRQALTPAPYALALPGLFTQQNPTSTNVIGGFNGNTVDSGVWAATIGGGGQSGFINQISANYGTIGGGLLNTIPITGAYATVGGGYNNTASGTVATIGGGYGNIANAQDATISGGSVNTASAVRSAIGGGYANTASGSYATIGGGAGNTVSSNYATIGGGGGNIASGNYYATVPGGFNNVASGDYSFAAGAYANTNNKAGAFVWGDSSTTTFISATAYNQFIVRATGGISLATSSNLSTGCYIPGGGGAWNCTSDRNSKTNFAAVGEREILAKLSNIPIQTWNYKTQDPSIRHIGPMAQDFFATFNVGEDNTHISTVDEGGVAFAAIQGLYEVVQEKDAEIERLKAQSNS